MSRSHLVGVDVGIGDELDLEPVVDVLVARLDEVVPAGHLPPAWITTHAVVTVTGSRAAIAVALPQVAGRADVAKHLPAVVGALAAPFGPGDHAHSARGPGVWSARAGTAGPRDLVEGARAACRALRAGRQGRAVRYAGCDALVGAVTVAELELVAPVVVLGSRTAAPGTARVATRDFVRPRLVDGRWVIHVQPAVDGTYVPFETPTPKRCCQDK